MPPKITGGGINYKCGGGFRFIIDDSVQDNQYYHFGFGNDDTKSYATDMENWLNAVKDHLSRYTNLALPMAAVIIYFNTDSFYLIKEILGDHIVIGYDNI